MALDVDHLSARLVGTVPLGDMSELRGSKGTTEEYRWGLRKPVAFFFGRGGNKFNSLKPLLSFCNTRVFLAEVRICDCKEKIIMLER